MEMEFEQQFRHEERRQKEDERVRPERDLPPEFKQKRPVVWRDARSPKPVDRQAGGHDSHDARNMEKAFGGDEDEIGKRNRQRPLGEPVVARPWDDLQEGAAGAGSEKGAAEERGDKLERHV